MDWIRRHKRTLQVLSALSALVVAAVIAALQGGPTAAESWQIGLVMLPAVLCVASFLPLVYLSWFGKSRATLGRAIAQSFFWIVVAAWGFVFVQIYRGFVFKLWQ